MEMTKFEYKWVTEEINVEASGYTRALAQSMQDTRNTILRKLLDDAIITPFDKHETEVNFNGQD